MATEKRMISPDVFWDNLDLAPSEWVKASTIKAILDETPTVDAVEVVHCEHCVNHGNCLTEDLFRMARIEKPYCCVGKMDGDGNG